MCKHVRVSSEEQLAYGTNVHVAHIISTFMHNHIPCNTEKPMER